jgi:hypothetical protein
MIIDNTFQLAAYDPWIELFAELFYDLRIQSAETFSFVLQQIEVNKVLTRPGEERPAEARVRKYPT